jgi:hypothetical protein
MANLFGPDFVIILLMFGFMAALVVGIVLLVAFLIRRKSPPPLPKATSTSERLQELEQLKEQSLISADEYQEQRFRIISGV